MMSNYGLEDAKVAQISGFAPIVLVPANVQTPDPAVSILEELHKVWAALSCRFPS